jgi:hypothetical protein
MPVENSDNISVFSYVRLDEEADEENELMLY